MRRSDAAAQRKEEGPQPEAEEAAEEATEEEGPLKRGRRERVSTSTMNESMNGGVNGMRMRRRAGKEKEQREDQFKADV